jgi:hypothetical protein
LGLLKAPSPENVRKALLANIPQIEWLEKRINKALQAARPSGLHGYFRRSIDRVTYVNGVPVHCTLGKGFPGVVTFEGEKGTIYVKHGTRRRKRLLATRKPRRC